jgi:hypothetical protein
MDMSKECAVQVMIWLWFDDFLADLCPFHFESNKKFSVRTLSPQQYKKLNLYLKYGYVKGMRRSSLNFVTVQCSLQNNAHFTLKNI